MDDISPAEDQSGGEVPKSGRRTEAERLQADLRAGEKDLKKRAVKPKKREF